ncbi:transcriptional initiation protein Tat [Photobacterium jeanii]|uniref:Transcriptional initiation protein Tat n=1 Tax=Photobacterium jeanii TaxID=858640 RepID=A0A178K929_9GAMM|nr:transcriptional initiation protein Tat [Photobacterium jeanii]
MSPFERREDDQYPRNQVSQLTKMIETNLSRRKFLGAASVMSAGAFMAGMPVTALANTSSSNSKLMGFKTVLASTEDAVIVPEGYNAQVLIRWGDGLFPDSPKFDPSGNAPSAHQALQFGDNNDGMTFFPLSENRGVLAVNNEYCNNEYLFAHQGKKMTADDVKKSQAAHGISIFEVKRTSNNNWDVVIDSKYNRRITANTPMAITGPLAGHPEMKTAADKNGKLALGTFGNCANGFTPWGTYLTCEENFNGYFGSKQDVTVNKEQKRYGLGKDDAGYGWSLHDERFDIAKNPNEANRHGWIVEIDPMDPSSTPMKRTAMGRFKHENVAVVINKDGHIVAYMGDDERGEHLYRFVSKNKYVEGNDAANRKLLEEGTVYVAKFSTDDDKIGGVGQWIELTHGKNGLTKENGFPNQEYINLYTRLAATQVGATTMDRPEWIAVHPNQDYVYCTLTNNKNRGVKEGQPVGGPNPREANNYGQILRWRQINDDHAHTNFAWDLYLMAGNPSVHKGTLYAGSDNINNDNMFNSPDGLGFDADGRLWIQTDGKYSNKGDYAGMGNNSMLCGDPKTGEVRRFLTGPIACEITGLTFSPDYKTMFIGIQHPGEELEPSHWPDGGNSTPRSSIVMITKQDGGVIGS